jgi:hypothetical protein
MVVELVALDNFGNMFLYLRPAGGRQDQDGKFPPFKILFVAQVLIRCDHKVELGLGFCQQLSVGQV